MSKKVQKINHDWLFEKPIAHRGLHGGSVMENSLMAYQKAIEKGYNIEIDVHILADGEIVVFHDTSLKRIFGDSFELGDMTYEQLSRYTLPFVNEKIPTLQEVLNLVDGKVGLLIEIKTYVRTYVAKKLSEMLANYSGEYAIQSFSPVALKWYRRHFPEVPLGILASDMFNFAMYCARIIKPEFISYYVSDLNSRKAEFLRNKTTKILAWTVTNPILEERARSYAENIIFEGYEADINARSTNLKATTKSEF